MNFDYEERGDGSFHEWRRLRQDDDYDPNDYRDESWQGDEEEAEPEPEPKDPEPTEGPPVLVLQRKKDQAIHIGDGIIVKILEIRGNAVKIGVEADRKIIVLRDELVGRHSRAEVVFEEPHIEKCPYQEEQEKGGEAGAA